MNRPTRIRVVATAVVGILGGASRVHVLPVPPLASYAGLFGGVVLGVGLPGRESLLSDAVKVSLGASAVFASFVVVGSFTGAYRFGVSQFRAMAVVGPVVEPSMMVGLYFAEVFAAAFVAKRLRRRQHTPT